MQELMTKILPIALFWLLEAVYLGGWPLDVRGGKGFQQVLGLLITFVLWVVVWNVASRMFGGLGPVLGTIVVASVVSTALLPVVTWIGFKIVGVSIQKVQAAH